MSNVEGRKLLHFLCIPPRIGDFQDEISKSVKLAFVTVLEI